MGCTKQPLSGLEVWEQEETENGLETICEEERERVLRGTGGVLDGSLFRLISSRGKSMWTTVGKNNNKTEQIKESSWIYIIAVLGQV